jgi:hypothetical protein
LAINARHDYNIEDTIEAGIALQGTEIKSIRRGSANLKDSYAQVKYGFQPTYLVILFFSWPLMYVTSLLIIFSYDALFSKIISKEVTYINGQEKNKITRYVG